MKLFTLEFNLLPKFQTQRKLLLLEIARKDTDILYDSFNQMCGLALNTIDNDVVTFYTSIFRKSHNQIVNTLLNYYQTIYYKKPDIETSIVDRIHVLIHFFSRELPILKYGTACGIYRINLFFIFTFTLMLLKKENDAIELTPYILESIKEYCQHILNKEFNEASVKIGQIIKDLTGTKPDINMLMV